MIVLEKTVRAVCRNWFILAAVVLLGSCGSDPGTSGTPVSDASVDTVSDAPVDISPDHADTDAEATITAQFTVGVTAGGGSSASSNYQGRFVVGEALTAATQSDGYHLQLGIGAVYVP